MNPFIDVPWLIAGLCAAVAGSLYAAADTATGSLSHARLGALIEQATDATKATLERIRREDDKLRSRYLLGRVVATALTAGSLVIAVSPSFADGHTGVYLALGAAILVTSLLFEITTVLARRYADSAAPLLARWLRPLEILMLPLAEPLSLIGALLNRRSRAEETDPRLAEAEVDLIVDEVERSGLVGPEPAEMIRNVLEFADLTAIDIMIPRSRIEAFELSTPIAEVVALVTESGHSRYPVYQGDTDNVVGLLYAKDLFKAAQQHTLESSSLADVIRSPANFVAGSQSVSSLLREMRSRRQHLAVVVDELGAVAGIVTLEDILEEIVGDIRDEHDEHEESPVTDLGEGHYLAVGDVRIRELSAAIGEDLSECGHESLDTLLTDGMIGIPKVGTEIDKLGLRFIVRDATEHQIAKVEIIRKVAETPQA